MLSDLPEAENPSLRNPALWWLLGALVVAQLMAFWLLCSHQVARAEARGAEAEMTQMALADCLQYIPGSTIASCTTRLGLAANTVPQPENSALQAGEGPQTASHVVDSSQHATPVGYSYR